MAVQVRCGPASTPISNQWIGQSVLAIRRALSAELGIPAGAPVTMSHHGDQPVRIDDNYVTRDGDVIEFIRTPGAKGR